MYMPRRVIGSKPSCGNFSIKNADYLVDSVEACAYFAKKEKKSGFCLETNKCYLSADLTADTATAVKSTKCVDGKGVCMYVYVCVYVCV
jgi:hypothetical protein